FIHHVRTWRYTIGSPDVDLFSMHGEINAFGEKQLLSRQAIFNLQLLSEELIQLVMPQLRTGAKFEFAVQFVEEDHTLNAWLHLPPGIPNPIESESENAALSLALIRNLATVTGYEAKDEGAQLTFRVNQESHRKVV
ncbi:MAG: hypothetical protein ACREO9_11330, partial [Lysobacterales bacterium]